MHFTPTYLNEAERNFRSQVRTWLEGAIGPDSPSMLGMAGPEGYVPAFSKALGRQGWLGLTIPLEFGGGGKGPVARLVLTEELLAAQAPVAAHWVADRQSAPVIASYGTPEQKARFIPPIVAGESYFSIGMSEPDSGSDLASIKTTAVKVEGGWMVTGTKVWTTLAHRNHWLICLCRTTPGTEKHEGLSQVLIDLHAPGVAIRAIETLDGAKEFCEVAMTDVFVPDELLLGTEGAGWAQVTGELTYERGGPDRYLSTWGVLRILVDQAATDSEEVLGRLLARYRIVRALALSAARALERGEYPATQAAITKDLGTILEQDTVEAARLWRQAEIDPASGDKHELLLANAVLTAPAFTLRGGTTEILRSMIARTAGDVPSRHADDLLGRTVHDILAGGASRDGVFAASLWSTVAEAGLPWVGVPEEAGGSGGTFRDAATILTAYGASAASLPLPETLIGGWLLAQADQKMPDGPLTLALDQRRVPFASGAVLVLSIEDDRLVGRLPDVTAGASLAGEERSNVVGAVVFNVAAPCTAKDLCDRVAATRVLMMAGGLRSVLTLVAQHTSTRRQFGQPLIRFQAVAQQVALLVEHVARVEMAAEIATRWLEGLTDNDDLAVATLTAREASTAGTRIAHQVHGAIGISAEYDLQLFTRRLWTWRDEAGSELSWARRLGAAGVAIGGDGLWAWTSR